MVGHLLRSADFRRVLSLPPCARSAHFAAHHVAARPSLPAKPVRRPAAQQLSTGDAPSCPPPVDDSLAQAADAPPDGHWLGLVVPKKHARRAVTRNLIKRQMRAVMACLVAQLPAGLWVLRLKAPFDRQAFISPASVALRRAARSELQQLLQRAAAPAR